MAAAAAARALCPTALFDQAVNYDFNLNLSKVDAKHDATGLIINIDFNSSFIHLFGDYGGVRAANTVDGILVTLNATVFYNTHQIYCGIQDNVKPPLNNKVTPSYYFDPASRIFNTYQGHQLRGYMLAAGAITIDLNAWGFTSRDITLTITLNDNILKYNFVDATAGGSDSFTVDINITNGWATTGSRYIASNEVKKRYFETNAHNSVEGAKYILGKLAGDYLHCVFCGPNDAVFTTDTYLRDRCVKNRKNVVLRNFSVKSGTQFIMYNAGGSAVALTIAPSLLHRHRFRETGGLRPRLRRRLRIRRSLEEKAGVEANRVSHRAFKAAASKRRGERAAARRFAPPAPPAPLDSGALGSTIVGGGDKNTTNFVENNTPTNIAYLAVLFDTIESMCASLKTFLAISSFKINGIDYKTNDQTEKYIASLIEFLSSVELKGHLNSIDKTQSVDVYTKELIKWMPNNILYSPADMSTTYKVCTNDYYAPHKITRIFPYQKDIIEISGKPFINNFPEGTFYNLAIQSFPELVGSMGDTTILINATLGFKDILSYLSKFNNNDVRRFQTEGVTMENKDAFLELLNDGVMLYGLRDSDIVKCIFSELISDVVTANRIYNLFTNLLMFNGLYLYNYDIVLDVIEIMNNESAGLEFLGEVERLDDVIFTNEFEGILSDDTISVVINNTYKTTEIAAITQELENALTKIYGVEETDGPQTLHRATPRFTNDIVPQTLRYTNGINAQQPPRFTNGIAAGRRKTRRVNNRNKRKTRKYNK
jgi:hypothetical protein